MTGPRLLEKSGVDVREEERNQQTEEEIEEQQWIMEHPDMVSTKVLPSCVWYSCRSGRGYP